MAVRQCHICFAFVLFDIQTVISQTAERHPSDVYQKFGPGERVTFTQSQTFRALPQHFTGGIKRKNWSDFRHQSPLTHCGFETGQDIGNLMLPP